MPSHRATKAMPELDTYTYVLMGAVIVLLVWVIQLEIRMRRLARGKSGGSLEGMINDLHKKADELFSHKHATTEGLQNLENRVKRSVQGVETIRFNPFSDQGGNQSFSTAILSSLGDGVVITGLYSRDKMSVYAKPVRGGRSEYELSKEEKEAIKKAQSNESL